MKRKIIMASLATLLAASLTGCGHTHAFGQWTVQKEASCLETGLKVRTCQCGEEETEELPAAGHQFGEWNILKEADCTTEGEQEHTCNVCGEVEKGAIDALGHTWGEWTILSEASCGIDGSQERICEICETKESGTIPGSEHQFTPATIYEPKTCTICGETEGEALSKALKKGEEVEEENHKFTLEDVIFTNDLKEKQGNTTYRYQNGFYLVLKLNMTNLATENLERWNSSRISDMKMIYQDKYEYTGKYTIFTDDIVPLQTRYLYVIYVVPESMEKDDSGSVKCAFSIDGTDYSYIVRSGEKNAVNNEETTADVQLDKVVAIGDMRTDGESFSFLLDDIIFSDNLKEKVGNTTYSFPSGYYMVLKMEFTNLSTETISELNSDTVTEMKLTYNDKYNYDGSFRTLTGDIVPLQTRNAYVYYEVPEELKDNPESLVAVFKIGGNTFEVNCRK